MLAPNESPPAVISTEENSSSGPFYAELTASGRGAISVIRVWGNGAIEAVDRCFRSYRGKRLEESAAGRLLVGRMGAGSGDEVVTSLLKTEVPAVEIQCHGGTAAVGMVLELLEHAGIRRSAHWPIPGLDFSGSDTLRAEAVHDLAHAPTLLAAEILLDQMHGAFSDEVARVAALARDDPAVACARLGALIERGSVGLRLLSGWKVVIAGRPNVGKSRLLNALCGFSRAIVDPTPGTTRDAVAFRTALGGWPVELVDTAGLRVTDHAVELLGIERAQRELGDADLVLLVLDRSENLWPIDRQLIANMSGALLVLNKSDLQPAWTKGTAGLDIAASVTISAERRDGMDALVEALVKRLVPAAPAPGEAIPFRAEHLELLIRARDWLQIPEMTGFHREIQSLMGGPRQ